MKELDREHQEFWKLYLDYLMMLMPWEQKTAIKETGEKQNV